MPMKLIRNIKRADVTDEPCDALIYSSNVMLNCSGGVGACLVAKYGPEVQTHLHRLLGEMGVRHAPRGSWFQWKADHMPYKTVFHTVPCDGWYETTDAVLETVLRECLSECVKRGDIGSVATSVLATGYGRFAFEDFFPIAARVFADPSYQSLERLTVCIEGELRFNEACAVIRQQHLALEITAASET